MRRLHPLLQSLLSPLHLTWLLLWDKVPAQGKRMCVLASLYCRLAMCDEDDMDRLRQLNNSLKLARDPAALRFPSMIAPYLWKRVLPLEKIDPAHTDRYLLRLLKHTPCWLWYADQQTRLEDLKRLMTYCQNDSTPQTA